MSQVQKNEIPNAEYASTVPFSNIVVIGLGLIGASLCAAIKKVTPKCNIYGVDSDSRSCIVAKERLWIDEFSKECDENLKSYIQKKAQLIVIATPVSAVDEYIQLLTESNYQGILTDTISTKSHILEMTDLTLKYPEKFIPGHPMCGSEQNGIDGARSDLFEGANWILCPDENTDPDSFQTLHEMILSLGARVVSIPREDHDKAVAIVSHVPHMVASALVQLASNHADESKALMRLAAGGFKDTTRVAAGSPELWCGIAFDNIDALQQGISEMTDILNSYNQALEDQNRAQFVEMLANSAEVRRSLPVAWVPGSDKLLEVRIPMVNRTGVVAEVTTIASSVGCNIQSIEIDHVSEGNAYLSLILTDEGDIGQLSYQLINAGYSVSFNPIAG